jgi:hypothetical protein
MNFDQAAYKRAEEVARLVVKKQNDYGPENILNCPVGVELGIAVRLNDKVSRLAHLVQSGAKPNNESLADTAADIMGYGLLLALYLNGEFKLPLGEGEDKEVEEVLKTQLRKEGYSGPVFYMTVSNRPRIKPCCASPLCDPECECDCHDGDDEE